MRPLDCDGVFEVLTRGPFPTGDASDGAVEQHLRCCYECRSLAEALRPAVELLHEAIDAEDCRDLPGYQGSLEPTQYSNYAARPGVAQMVMAAIAAETVTAPTKASVQRATWRERLVVDRYRFATAMAIGALLAFVCWSLHTESAPERVTTATRPARFAPSEQGVLTLAAMRLPAGCFSLPIDSAPQAAHAWHCCTECHTSSKEPSTPSQVMLLAVVQSCRACHP